MNFDEFIERNEEAIGKAKKCRNIDEFRKLVNENHIDYSGEEELKRAWGWVKSQDRELDDDALNSVAGGKKDTYKTENIFHGCTGAKGGSSMPSSN